MVTNSFLSTIPFLALYPETHFRFFRFFPSLLYKKEPEIIFDAPSRLEPQENLPLFLTINDIHLFPIEPLEVAITISQTGGIELLKFDNISQYEIRNQFSNFQKSFIFEIPKEKIPFGSFFINAMLIFKKKGKIVKILNDNINTSTKLPLICYRANSSLPGRDEGLCCYGDLHFHTQFSQSHVEFGPPLKVIDYMCKSSGISFIGLTDHSYDLSCLLHDYLKEDLSLEKWNCLISDIQQNSYHTIFLLGEEISCKNSKGETVHLVALNNKKFIEGSSDGARKKKLFKDKKIEEVIDSIHKQGGIAFAAHPASHCSLLERLLLNRGNWGEDDLGKDIDGIQFFNSGFDKAWEKGKRLWIKMLNKGHKIPLLAGNDAHGDFNRYRAIKFPFVSIYEDFKRFMGYGKTGIYGNCRSKDEIISKIKSGETFISTGPYISISSSQNPLDNLVSIRKKVSPFPQEFYLHLISNEEYGALKKVSLWEGSNESSIGERKFFEKTFNEPLFKAIIPIENKSEGKYIRAELEASKKNGETTKAFTSCCWFKD